MAIASLGKYDFPSRDKLENFHGNQLIYIGWDHHTMICSARAFPASPQMRFGDLLETFIPAAFARHPDFASINWDEVIWIRDDEEFVPDMDGSIADNQIVHKGAIRFKTPGLNGIQGTGS